MNYRILSDTDKKRYGADVAVTVTYADLVALAPGTNTGTLNIGPFNATQAGTNKFPAGTKLKLEAVNVNTEFTFSDSGNACAVTLGDTGSANRYLASFSCISGAGNTWNIGTGTSFLLTSADNLKLAFTGQSGKDLGTATAGSLTFWLRADNFGGLPTP
jgi:hypothetical protein